jgi:DnaJ-class molecular chaperone
LPKKPGPKNKVRRRRQVKQEPERCPVCEGRGMVPQGFYGEQSVATQTGTEPCRSCGGAGIITTPAVVEQEQEKRV